MVYIPRHDRHKKKRSYFGFIVLGIILIVGAIGIYKFKEIQLVFSRDGRTKLNRLEKKITDELASKKLSSDLAKDYSKAAESYLNMDFINSEAFYFLALSYYYEILSIGFDIENSQIALSCLKERSYLLPQSKSFILTMEKMYRAAKRAEAFDLNPEYTDSNQFFIFFYEIFRSSKKNVEIAKEFSMIDKGKLAVNLIPLYQKIGLVSSCFAGDIKFIEKILEEEKSEKLLSKNEVSLLKGSAFFHSNEFVRSLESLRKIDDSANLVLKRESRVLEAMIFFKQNLHQKSIELLEKQYEESEKKDEEILKKIYTIVKSKKDLKSKYVLEEEK